MPLYELEEGSSRKFYRIEREGTRVHLHWGRIGTAGEKQTLELETDQEATAEHDRHVRKRREHGYRLVLDETKPHDPETARKERLARTAPLTKSPRFYFVNKKAKAFLWIEAREAELLMAEGALGKEVSAPVKAEACASAAAAVKKRDAAIATLLGKGFALADFGAAETKPKKARPKSLSHNEELEARIRESGPGGDEDGWVVLEDWLLEHDDPRAELVRLEKIGDRGDIAQERGRLASLLYGAKSSALEHQRCEWRAGFALSCVLVVPKRKGVELVEAFTKAPAMRLLRSLSIGGECESVRPVIELLSRAPFANGLRTLTLNLPLTAQELSPLLEGATPRLTSLSLLHLPTDTVNAILGRLATSSLLPHLHSLSLGRTEVSPEVLRLEYGTAFDHLANLTLERLTSRSIPGIPAARYR